MADKPVVDPFNNSNVECDNGDCADGVAERICDDYAPDTGPGYSPINGSVLIVDRTRSPWQSYWLCASCGADESLIQAFAPDEQHHVYRSKSNAVLD